VSALRELAVRVRAFLTRARHRDAGLPGLNDELAFHLEMLEQQLRRQGRSPDDARREARLQLGGTTQIAEAYGDQRTLPILESVLQDARYAVRTLLRTPAFTAAALLTLAIGIGANTAIFSIVHAILLRPLPYAAPDRLVAFGERGADGLPGNIGFTTFADFRDQARAFEGVAAVRSWQPTLVTTEAERVNAMRVSWNFFSMLGVQPALGRGFTREDDHPDRYRVLMLSDGLWRRRFGADPGVIGRSIRMNDRTYEIVGVMPPTFEPLLSAYFYQPAELWAPLGYESTLPYACRGCRHLRAVGRLRDGVSMQQAMPDLARVRHRLMEAFPQEYPAGTMAAIPLQQLLAGPVRGGLYVLAAAVGFVLLIACANVANLLLARAVNRTREMSVRAALGAGRGRLIRQMLTESAVLSAAGGAGGVALAGILLPLLDSLAPLSVPRLDAVRIDGVVLAFAAGLSLLTGVVFGLIPAIRATSVRLRAGLTGDGRATIGGPQTARQLLVVVDIALALVLLAGAGLMTKSLTRLMRVDPGFSAERVLTLQFSLIGEAYREDPQVVRFTNGVLEKVRALPGVEEVAAAGQIPMGGNADSFGFHIDGLMHPNPADDPSAERYSVTPGYFRVMNIPLRRGRIFTDADGASAAPVMLVSESAARLLFNGTDPIGRRVRVGNATSGPWRTIVGIVGDVHHADLSQPATPQMYLPQAQFADSFLVMTIKLATADPLALLPAVRGIIRQLDPSVPVYEVATLEDLVARSVAQRRFVMTLLASFAAVALLLASVGLYGVVSYTVAQRRREVGLRMALGAAPSDIARLVLGSGARTVGVGLVAGVICAAALTQFLRALLFQVEAFDPWTLAAAVLTLATVAGLAHSVPLRRALRVDPAIALRQD
jgi:putative ABC transport system permease protein